MRRVRKVEVQVKQGEDTTRTANPNSLRGYFTPYYRALSDKTGIKEEEGKGSSK